MKAGLLLQLAALSTAFVIPDEQVFAQIQSKDESVRDRAPEFSDLRSSFENALERFEDGVEDVIDRTSHAAASLFDSATERGYDALDQVHEAYFDTQGWLETVVEQDIDSADALATEFDKPHHGRRPGHHRGGHHHHKPNKTVYEIIASSKYTTKLAKLINEFPDLVEALNGTKANYTVFAPNDYAFSKIPEHAPKPSKEQLKKLLTYHVSPEFYPAGRILVSRTIPSLLKSPELGKGNPQRLNTNIGLRGLTVNFYSRVVKADIFGTNGVIHGVDSIILPPPKILKIISLLPSEFSTLELGLAKTGLIDGFNKTHPNGSTVFAPSNFAFRKLGPRVNAFLFSARGVKYLKALLEYHVVPGRTLYSDAYYSPSEEDSTDRPHRRGPPKGYFHFDLPTLLEDREISVDIGRYGRLIEIKLNGFSRVAVSDGVAKDGVIHAVSSVLIPPKTSSDGAQEMWDGESEMSVEEFTERFDAHLELREDL